MQKVLAVPDMHLPWVDSAALGKIYQAIEREKPTVIIQLGDLYDMYSQSRFPRNHDICTPKEEMAEARLGAEGFWKNCKKAAHRSTRLVQILGNHDARPSKRVAESYPEVASLLGIDNLFKFPGVETVLDSRSEFTIDGVIYTHGHYLKLGQHCAYYLRPVVHGHTHRPGVIFQKIHGKIIWEADGGHVADEDSEPLQYTPTKTTKWAKAYVTVDQYGPRVCPI